MTKIPGENPLASPFQAQFTAYGGGDLSAPGSEATLGHITFFHDTVYGRIAEAAANEEEASQVALAFVEKLGTVMLAKTIQEFYEQHGTVVSALVGPEPYQKALLEKAQYDILPANQKAKTSPRNPHSYVSEIVFRYANDCSEFGIFDATPTELRFMDMQGGDPQQPNFFNRRQITVWSAETDGIYTKSADFEIPSDSFLPAISRLALGAGISDEVEKEFDQPLLDLVRMKLSATEGQRLEHIAVLFKAQGLAQGPLRRLEVLQGMSDTQLEAHINATFEAKGHSKVFGNDT